jgi:hypothetical protein
MIFRRNRPSYITGFFLSPRVCLPEVSGGVGWGAAGDRKEDNIVDVA